MKKFDELIRETTLQLEADPAMDLGLGGAPDDAGGAMPPMGTEEPPPTEKPETTKLTPEGKRFLIELVMKALAFDPHNIPDYDKNIFDEEVTPENAEELLGRIREIIGGHDIPSSAPEDQDIA